MLVSPPCTSIDRRVRKRFCNYRHRYTQGSSQRLEPGSRNGDCFATVTQADLVDARTGIKVFGGALHRMENVILLQAFSASANMS